jgi:catechol 2,3-dioxygenase-like lactoylglutathione lyase family enzyme
MSAQTDTDEASKTKATKINAAEVNAAKINPAKIKAGWATPLMHVAEIERSIAFYRKLGFVVVDTDRGEPLGWARLHCEGGAVMLLRAEEPVDGAAQAVSLTMYTEDLPAMRAQLLAEGVEVPAIAYPEYLPKGEVRLRDPDGYGVGIVHWSDAEHSAWLKRIESEPLRSRD